MAWLALVWRCRPLPSFIWVGGGTKESGNSSINDLSTLHHSRCVVVTDILCGVKLCDRYFYAPYESLR